MYITKQIAILFAISFFSEIISSSIPFVFPTSLLAMIILFFMLICKIIREKDIYDLGDFLQKNISIFFIPPAISIMEDFHYIKDKLFIVIFISVASFFITFFVTVYTVQFTIKIMERRGKNGISK